MTKPNQPEGVQQPLPFFGRSQQETRQPSSARGKPLVEPTDPRRCQSTASRLAEPPSNIASANYRILDHSSPEVIQDAGPKSLSAARLTPAAIPEVLTLLRQLHEQLGPPSERGPGETEATDARRGSGDPSPACGSSTPTCDSPAPRSSVHRETREAPEADDTPPRLS